MSELPPIDVTITYLEMLTRPTRPSVPAPGVGKPMALLRADPPTVPFYRYLYDTIGGPWLWTDRRIMSDSELRRVVQHPEVEVHVLYVGGTPAGYAELDRREPEEAQLAYFGLMPEFIGQGLGWYLLNWAIDRAWTATTARLRVNTCDLDHPRALGNYQRAGFVPYEQRTIRVADRKRLELMHRLRQMR
jgi:GNAT superfamily N-acetyltransferase